MQKCSDRDRDGDRDRGQDVTCSAPRIPPGTETRYRGVPEPSSQVAHLFTHREDVGAAGRQPRSSQVASPPKAGPLPTWYAHSCIHTSGEAAAVKSPASLPW